MTEFQTLWEIITLVQPGLLTFIGQKKTHHLYLSLSWGYCSETGEPVARIL